MPEINLLKNELQGRPGSSLGRASTPATYIIIGLLVLEGLGYGGLMLYQRQLVKYINETDQRAAKVNAEIGQIDQERQEAISFQSRLKNLQILLDNHLFWSSLFAELEKSTYKPAVYKDFQANPGENKMTITGTIPTYTDLGKFLLGLKTSPKILDVALQSSGQKDSIGGGYSFVVEVVFDPKLLSK